MSGRARVRNAVGSALQSRGALIVATALATAVFTIGGLALAGIPDDTGIIHGCYKVKSGALRVVDADDVCKPKEMSISWNQEGPPGIRGEAGGQGPRGAQGAQGAHGATGATGVTGGTGPPGAPGAPGTALAYGRVAFDGTVTLGNNLTSANVSKQLPFGSGGITVYCFGGLSVTVSNVQVTPVIEYSPFAAVPAGVFCPAGFQQFQVSGTANTTTTQAFFVLIN